MTFDIATVSGIQASSYETKKDFVVDYERCKKLKFSEDVLGQLETIAARIDSDRFPISFVRAQDPRVHALIAEYKPRPFIPLEKLAK